MRKLLALTLAFVLMLALAIPAFAAEVDPNATLYFSTVADPKICDPALASDGESGVVIDRVFSGLMRYAPDGTVYPEIAESVNVSDDGLTYTFAIREGNTFHDGTVLDAAAVKWNFDRQIGDAAQADMPYAKSFYGNIEKCEAVDALTFVVTLKAPSAAFLIYTAQRIGMGIASPTAWEADPVAFQRNPIGSGPYMFEEWEPDQFVMLKANPNYILGAPVNSRLVFKVIKESSVRTSEVLTGGIDAMGNIALDDIDRLKSAENLTVEGKAGKNIGYLAFVDYQTKEGGIFADKRLREALWCALDRESLIKGLYGENMTIAKSIIPPVMQAGDADYVMPSYDPEKAKALMAEAGYPDGFKFTMLSYNVTKGYNPAAERLSIALQNEFSKLNISVSISIMPWAEYLTACYAEDCQFDTVLAGWGAASNDTSYMLQLLMASGAGTGANHSGFTNEAFETTLKAAMAEADYDTRTALYVKAMSIANEELPMLYIGHGNDYAAYSKSLNAKGWYGQWGLQEDHIEKYK